MAYFEADLENQFPTQNRFNHLGEFTSYITYLQDFKCVALAMHMSYVFCQVERVPSS